MACLSETAVLQLLEGQMAHENAPGAEAHLADCAECRRLVSELSRTLSPDTHADALIGPGVVIAGRFRLERLLGRGGMGEVWAAKHLITRREVALKLVRGASDERARRRVEREARAASCVRHPNVLPVIDVLELDDGTPALVMDLLTGQSLATRIAEGGALTLAETVRVMLPVAVAMRAAHTQGVIHRDLKPDNIFLCDDGTVKVLDFGVAKVQVTESSAGLDLTRSGEIIGTPHYLAPEQAFGESDLDHRTDVWALGVTTYECLAGTRPFEGESLGPLLFAVTNGRCRPISDRVPNVSPRIARLVDRMLSVERAKRPTLEVIVAELEAIAAGRTSDRGRAIGIASAAMVVVMTIASTIYWVSSRPARIPNHARTTAEISPPKVAPVAEPNLPHASAAGESPSASVKSAPVSPTRKSARPPGAKPSDRLPGGVIETVPF